MIVVTDDDVIIAAGSSTASGAQDLTVDQLEYAAGVLSRWLDLPFRDIAKESQRISRNDQFGANLRDVIAEHIERE